MPTSALRPAAWLPRLALAALVLLAWAGDLRGRSAPVEGLTRTDPAASAASETGLILDGPLGEPSTYGLAEFESALRARGVTVRRHRSLRDAPALAIVVGTPRGSSLVRGLVAADRSLPDSPEALAVRHLTQDGRSLLVVAGHDDRGLMYALLDLAQQLGALRRDADWWTSLQDRTERPVVPVRRLVLLLHNRDDEREWYYSKEFWYAYLGMLAANRWNGLNLVFSHQTPYLAPMYPFHVRVPEHPEVAARGITDAERDRNLEMLRFISQLATDRGLEFTLGIWQQIAWEGRNQSTKQASMVTGFSRQNMHDYTPRALATLLRACPSISGVELRVNHESGLDYDEQTAFFRDVVFRTIREAGRPIRLELRNVGLLRETVEAGLESGLRVRVSHKYWGEHMVFPYHPTQIMWTYSYGDWLRYPQRYENLYEVWTLGSHRLLLWGDPDFVRRFAPTTTFQDAAGFEIDAPLSQKGYLNAPGAWRLFEDPSREYYRWEFERYWSFYRLFGRLTYNPSADDEIWLRELRRRFGDEAAPAVASAYRSASQVVSLVAAVAASNYNMGIWPEKDMGGLIDFYLNLKPYDRVRIRGFLESIDDHLAGRDSAALTPGAMATRLDAVADDTERALERAGALVRGDHNELWATTKDFRILAGMARYHARKIRAALGLGFYYRLGDLGALRGAIAQAEDGLAIWKRLAQEADEIYVDRLVFGPSSVGHWKDNIPFVEHDVATLREQERLFGLVQNFDFGFDFGPPPFTNVIEAYSTTFTNDYLVDRRFTGVFPHSFYSPGLGYGWSEAPDLGADRPPQVPGSVWRAASRNDRQFPPEALLGDFVRGSQPAVFRMDLPEGHYQAAVIMTDRSVKPADHGPLGLSVVERFGERPILTDVTVRAGDTLVTRFDFNMIGDRFSTFRLKLTAAPGADFILNAFTITRIEPHIAHVPLRRADPGAALRVAATVTLPPKLPSAAKNSLSIARGTTSTVESPDRIVSVTLRYAVGDEPSYRAIDMRKIDEVTYEATVPERDVTVGSIRYHLEAVDSVGRIVRLPAASHLQPDFSIDVTDDGSAPSVEHTPVDHHAPGQPLEIRARVTDQSGVDRVLLRHRPTRQTMEYATVVMQRRGSDYVATIPGQAIDAAFDLLYYFEAIDTHGNGRFHPNPDVTQPYVVVKIRR